MQPQIHNIGVYSKGGVYSKWGLTGCGPHRIQSYSVSILFLMGQSNVLQTFFLSFLDGHTSKIPASMFCEICCHDSEAIRHVHN